MNVYWLEQTDADVPAENQWLAAGEILILGRLRFAKRRNDWRLGRWTAKRALAACLDLPSDLLALANIEIRAAASGAPEAFLFNRTPPVTISISHRAGTALCTVALSRDSVGCDLEIIEPRSDAFISDYFTAREQALVERPSVAERSLLATLVWSAKESALKALRTGLRLDTNCLDVRFDEMPLPHTGQQRQEMPVVATRAIDPDSWCPLHVRYSGGQLFYGWWRKANQMVRTIISALPLSTPIHSVAICGTACRRLAECISQGGGHNDEMSCPSTASRAVN